MASSAPAHALDEVDSETRSIARELALQGADAFEKQDFQTALDRFQRAATLFRAPSITVMLARSLARMGRFLEALDRYEETQRLPLPPDAPEAFQHAVDDARSEARALRARIPRLEVRAGESKSRPSQLVVTLDGRMVPAALLDVERPIDPGAHVLTATAPGMAPFQQEFSLTEGERRAISLPLPAALTQDGPAAPSKPSEPSSSPNNARLWGFGLGGVGVVGLATGAITGAIALNHKSDLDQVCHPGCPASSADDISAFRLNRTLSYTGFVLGAAALGVGGYLLYSDARAHKLQARITPQGFNVGGVF
ncbi:MAG: hypothetical protein QM756_18405 [Polyangiaceae bacterium]